MTQQDSQNSNSTSSFDLKSIVIALIGLGFGGYGLFGAARDDLVIPYTYTRAGDLLRKTTYVHMHGALALLGCIGFLLIAAAAIVFAVQKAMAPEVPRHRRRVVDGLAVIGAGIIIVSAVISYFSGV